MRTSLKWILSGLAIAVAGVSSSIADATTVLFLSRDELVVRSTVVARVTVGKAVTGESADGASIVTRTELDVTQLLKGAAPQRLVLEQIGGTYKGKTQRVLGDGALASGEDAVVFLKVDDKGRAYLTALGLAVYHVDASGIARRDLENLSLMTRTNGKLVPTHAPHEAPEAVEHLMTDVVRIAGSK